MQRTLIAAFLLFAISLAAATPSPGPDGSAEQYRSMDSTGAGFGPAMNWAWNSIAPAASGRTAHNIGDDGYTGALNLGFTFDFYGQPFTQVRMNGNGFLQFGGTGNALDAAAPHALPNGGGSVHNIVAAYWTDLMSNCAGALEYTVTQGTSPNRVFVAEWVDQVRQREGHVCGNGVTFLGNAVLVTMQVRLYETSNNIEIFLKSTPTDNNNGGQRPSVVGIENGAGSEGLQYAAPGNNPFTNRAVRIFPNHAPEGAPAELSVLEDDSVDFTLAGSDQDLDTLTYSYDDSGVVGTISGTAPDLTFTPDADDFGTAGCLQYSVTDQLSKTSQNYDICFTIDPVNDAPSYIAGPTVNVDQDSGAYAKAWATNVEVGPSNEANQQPTFTLIPTDASLFATQPTINSEGTLSFTPASGKFGSTNVLVKMQDDGGTANGGTDSVADSTFVIKINEFIPPPNGVPVADDQTLSMDEDTSLMVVLTGWDPDGDALTFSVSTPSDGTILKMGEGLYSFTPAANFNGMTFFSFTVSDGMDEATAYINIDVQAVNDAPVGTADVFTVTEGETLEISWADVLANDVDVDGDALTVIWGEPTIGAFISGDPASYTAPDLFSGPVEFSYTLTDGVELQTVGVTIFVQERANSQPIANDDTLQMERGGQLQLDLATLMANDLDPDGDPLTITIIEWPSTGVFVAGTYTPEPNFAGTVTFVYQLQDNRGGVDFATVTLGVVASEPIANFAWLAPSEPIARGHEIQFTDLSLQASDPLVAWEWNIDGTKYFGQQIYHITGNLGDFTATLKVTDALGRTSTTSEILTVTHRAPTSFFVPDPGPYQVGQWITFHDFSSDDNGIESHTWDYSDGRVSHEPEGRHAFTAAGTYVVRLSVFDIYGAAATSQITLRIDAIEPVTAVAEVSQGGGNQAASLHHLVQVTAPVPEPEPEQEVVAEVQSVQTVQVVEVKPYDAHEVSPEPPTPWAKILMPTFAFAAIAAAAVALWARKLA